ncbi:MAG: hypothetical protein ACRCTI_06100, partial [Beijerinckiaceae bacterium]
MIALRPWMTAALSICGFVLMAWYLVATLYFVFRDEMLGRLISQQAEMQHAYEDRLAALRNQIDRVTSRQLVDQNSIDAKMQELLARHAQLETRHALVATLAEQQGVSAPRAPVRPGQRAASDAQITTGSTTSFAAPQPLPGRDAFDLRMPEAPAERRMNHSALQNLPPAVAVMEMKDAIERIERQQIAAVDGLEVAVRKSAQQLSLAFAETGLDPARFAGAAKAQGGPLVPVTGRHAPGSFEQRLSQAQFTIAQTERMRRIVGALPVL